MFKKLALLIFGIFIGLACVEIGLRAWNTLTAEKNPAPDAVYNLGQFVKYDELLGWSPLPGAISRERTAEYDVEYRINSSGFRDDQEIQKEKTLPRVVVAGDSFAFGIGVEGGDTYTKRLAEMFGYEGINLGLGGYDPGQYFLRMRRDGLPLDPDVIVYGIYLGNDIQEIDQDAPYQSKRIKPRFSVDDNVLTLHNVPVPQSNFEASSETDYRIKNKFVAKFARAASRTELFSLVKNVFKNYLYKELAWLGFVKDIDDFSQKFELLEAVLEESKHEFGERPFVIVIIPSFNIANNYLEQRFDEKLEQILVGLDIPYVDLEPYVRESANDYYFPIDRHFNEAGHELAAQKLAELIRGLQ